MKYRSCLSNKVVNRFPEDVAAFVVAVMPGGTSLVLCIGHLV